MSVKYNKLNGNERSPLVNPGLKSENRTEYQPYSEDIVIHTDVVETPETPATETQKKVSLFSMASRNQKLLLVFCTTAYFLSACACSLLMSFFPFEAEKKGVSQATVGFIFSVYELNVFIVSPFLGNYLGQIGAKFVYISGIFVGGVGSILFGVLDKGPDGVVFIVMCVLCRSTEAIGFAGFITACLAIITNELPEHVGTVYAIIETGAGVGFMCGPVIGGALYELGGYGLPFYVTGSLIFVNGIVIYVLMPDTQEGDTDVIESKSMLKFIVHPLVMVSLMSVFVGVVGVFALDSTFAQHLKPFNLNAATVGLIFVIASGVYALTAPLWGYLTDTKDCIFQMNIFGYVVFSLGFLFLGPSQLLPFVPFKIWTVIVGLILLGVSAGCLYIPTMKSFVLAAKEMGYPKSPATFAMTSGLFNSITALGGCVGPFAGSALVQVLGYSMGYSAISAMSIFALLIYLGFSLYQNSRKAKQEPRTSKSRRVKEDGAKTSKDSSENGRYDGCKDKDPEGGLVGNGSRRTSLSTSTVSGVPALSLSTTVSEQSTSSVTSRDKDRTNREINALSQY